MGMLCGVNTMKRFRLNRWTEEIGYFTPTVLPDITTVMLDASTGTTSLTNSGKATFDRPNNSLAGLSLLRDDNPRRETQGISLPSRA
jgi:hypothetical protein